MTSVARSRILKVYFSCRTEALQLADAIARCQFHKPFDYISQDCDCISQDGLIASHPASHVVCLVLMSVCSEQRWSAQSYPTFSGTCGNVIEFKGFTMTSSILHHHHSPLPLQTPQIPAIFPCIHLFQIERYN